MDLPLSLAPTTRKSSRTKRQNKKKIARLSEVWSRFSDQRPAMPLSIGIDSLMRNEAKQLALPITEKQIKQGLYAYTSRYAYYLSLSKNPTRYNHHGKPQGKVSGEHREEAIKTLKEMTRAAKKSPKPKSPQRRSIIKLAQSSRNRSAPAPKPEVIYKRPRRRQIESP